MFSGGTSKPKNLTIGKIGEDLACEYLVDKGYKILKRNYKEKWDEIDIICRAKDRTLVFVEVKTFGDPGGPGDRLAPEDNMTAAKLKKLRRACEAFAGKHVDLIEDRKGWRIDLLAITLKNPITMDKEIRYYENI